MYIVMIVDTQRKVVLLTRVRQTIAKKFDGHKNPSEDVAHKAITLVWVYVTFMFKLCSPCIEAHMAVLEIEHYSVAYFDHITAFKVL